MTDETEVKVDLSRAGILDEFNVELPKEEAVQEAVQPTEQSTEQPTGQPTGEVTAEPTDWLDLSKLNAEFGTSFQSRDEIKEIVSSLNTYKELAGKKGYYDELEKILPEVIAELDGRTGTPEEFAANYTINQLAQGRDRGIAERIVKSDISKMDAMEAIVLQYQFSTPTLADKHELIVKSVLQDLGIDVEDPDFDPDNVQIKDPSKVVKYARMEADAKEFLRKQVDSVQVPAIKDFKKEIQDKVEARKQAEVESQSARQKRVADWGGKAKELADQITKIDFTETKDGKEVVDFTYQIPKEFLNEVVPYLVEFAVENGYDINPESVSKVQAEFIQFIKDERQDEIRKAYASEMVSRTKAEMDTKVHNPKPINTQDAPPEHEKDFKQQVNEAFKLQYGLK